MCPQLRLPFPDPPPPREDIPELPEGLVLHPCPVTLLPVPLKRLKKEGTCVDGESVEVHTGAEPLLWASSERPPVASP